MIDGDIAVSDNRLFRVAYRVHVKEVHCFRSAVTAANAKDRFDFRIVQRPLEILENIVDRSNRRTDVFSLDGDVSPLFESFDRRVDLRPTWNRRRRNHGDFVPLVEEIRVRRALTRRVPGNFAFRVDAFRTNKKLFFIKCLFFFSSEKNAKITSEKIKLK